jgi:hypothetical protein
MFEVVLVLPFQLEATPKNPTPTTEWVFKAVKVPALPFIGSTLTLLFIEGPEQCERDRFVESIQWRETDGQFFIVLDKHVCFGNENHESARRDVHGSGWSGEVPSCHLF